MKKVFALLLVLAITTALEVMAGDDEVVTLQSVNPTVACTSALTIKRTYAVQCDGTTRVKTSSNTTTDLPSNSSVSIPSGQLYDLDTTYDKPYICVLAGTGTVNCNVFIHRGVQE